MKYAFLILLTLSFGFSGEKKTSDNKRFGIGWDSGLTFQKYISDDSFWGLRVNGNFNKGGGEESEYSNDLRQSTDTTRIDDEDVRKKQSNSDQDNKWVRFDLRYGKMIYKYKKIELFGVIQPFFRYSTGGMLKEHDLENNSLGINESLESDTFSANSGNVTKLGGVQFNIEPCFVGCRACCCWYSIRNRVFL